MAIKVIVVGAGYFAHYHINAWLRLPDVELVAIVEQDQKKHKALLRTVKAAGSKQTTVTDDLRKVVGVKPDLIDIATPPHTHATFISEAISLQCSHVICQKPFCGDLHTAKKTYERIQKSKTTVIVHENFRFQPWFRHIKTELDKSTLGTVLQASFRLRPGDGQGQDAYLSRQPYFRDMSKFLIHETGVHFIDVFRYLFGHPQAVSADLQRLNPAIKGEDAGHFVFYYENGLRAHFDGNRLLDHAADNTRLTMGEMLIEGTRGSIALFGNGDLLHREFGCNAWHALDYVFEDTDFGGDCVYHLQQHVVDHLINGRPLENDIESYLNNLEIESIVYRAADEQRRLQVTDYNSSENSV